MLSLRAYGRSVARATAVVLGVLAAISALTLVVIGILTLVHSHHQQRPSPVVTVTTSR